MHHRELQKPDGRALHLYSLRPIEEGIQATNPIHDPITSHSHLRWHPLRGEWVAYASHRQNRTFLPPPEYSPLAVTHSPEFPTELPAGDYDVAVFDNLFSSLRHGAVTAPDLGVETKPGTGICEVIVFSQNPTTSLAEMPLEQVDLVLQVMAERTRELSKCADVKYVLPFENRGVEVGVTIHHPHGQIYAYPFVPPVPAKMAQQQAEHWLEKKRTLISDLITEEERDGRRMILSSESTVAFIPVCARYPYETWVAPRRAVSWLYELSASERLDLAKTLKVLLMKFDRMWSKPFPYLMCVYQALMDGRPDAGFHTHFEIFPPYRTRDRLKFLAGTELGGGMFVNDSLPEEKAAELRSVEVTL